VASNIKVINLPIDLPSNVGTGATPYTSLQVVCYPFTLKKPFTLSRFGFWVQVGAGFTSIDFAIFTADKLLRLAQTGWYDIPFGNSIVRYKALTTSVDLEPRTYILAQSLKWATLADTFTQIVMSEGLYDLHNYMGRMGLNSVNANATTGIPSTLSTITYGTAQALQCVSLIGD
jgi:hypothetical protein